MAEVYRVNNVPAEQLVVYPGLSGLYKTVQDTQWLSRCLLTDPSKNLLEGVVERNVIGCMDIRADKKINPKRSAEPSYGFFTGLRIMELAGAMNISVNIIVYTSLTLEQIEAQAVADLICSSAWLSIEPVMLQTIIDSVDSEVLERVFGTNCRADIAKILGVNVRRITR